MTPAEIAALSAALGTALGAAAAWWAQSRKAPSEAALAEAQAEKARRESEKMLLDSLNQEVVRLKSRVVELEERVVKSEARAAGAETRLADAEMRANEFRKAVIHLGERLDKERAKSRDTAAKLLGIIHHLLDVVEDPTRVGEVDRQAIRHLEESIMQEIENNG